MHRQAWVKYRSKENQLVVLVLCAAVVAARLKTG